MGAVAIGGLMVAQGALNAYGQREQGKAGAKSTAMQAAADAANQRMQGAQIAANAKVQAANYDALADYYLREAGNFQMQGRDERTMRGLQLGQDKGRIVAQASGSGIDVTSKVVTKTIADTVKSAYHDYETSAWNEYQKAYGAMSQSRASRVNAANQRAIAAWAENAYGKLAGYTEKYGLTASRNASATGNIGAASSLFGGLTSAAAFGVSSGGTSTSANQKYGGSANYSGAEWGAGGGGTVANIG